MGSAIPVVIFIPINIQNLGENCRDCYDTAGTTYIPGKASTTQGTVSNDGQLIFDIGSQEYDKPVALSFAATVNPQLAEPNFLTGTIDIAWNGGEMTLNNSVIANDCNGFLPITRT